MSSSRVVDATPINLKERIAALQQLTTNPPQTPTLPPNNDASSALQTPAANANIKLREKIARFEKKGGVPVPRGSFGLGAPPVQDGHTKRQNELYGNRIPQPLRVTSGPQGANPPSGNSHPPSAMVRPRGNNRRSFSLSNVNTAMASEFTGGADTPLTSPSAGEPTHQASSLSAESLAKQKGEEGQSTVVSPLPAIVVSQGEGDNVDGATAPPSEAGVDAEVPDTADNVTTPSASESASSSPNDISGSPSLSSPPPSASPPSPQSDAVFTSSPTSPPALPKTLPQTSGPGRPLADSITRQQASNNKLDLVSSSGIGVESPQSVSEESSLLEHSAKKIPQKKENLRADKARPPALDLDSGTAQPQNHTAKSTPPESETPSSPTTPHATQAPPPAASLSTSIKPATTPETRSQSGASARPVNTVEPTPSPNQPQLVQKPAESGGGSVTLPHQDSSLHQNSSCYRAVVHNKKRDDLTNSRSLTPQAPQVHRASSVPSSTNVSTTTTTSIPGLPVISTSSGFGDLSDLLQSTVLLEQTLDLGLMSINPGIPAIVADDDGDVSHEVVTTLPDGVEVRRLSKGEVEENKRTLAKLQAKREEQAKSKLRSSFRNTLSRAVGGGNGGPTSGAGVAAPPHAGESAATALQQEQPQYYSKRFKSPSVPHLLDSTPDDGLTRSKTPENQTGRASKPASVTSGKSTKSRFANFRRLASKSSEGHGGRLARSSFSTSSEISSEDSSPAAITPPDDATEFGEAVKGRKSTANSEMSWQGSPQKKGKDPMSRAATFAGKIWSRARTRSGASTQSSLGRTSSEIPPSLPPLPNLILPEESDDSPVLVNPPARSTSLSPRSATFPSLPSQPPDLTSPSPFDAERTGSATPVQSFKHSNNLSPESPPSTYNSRRRSEMLPSSSSTPPSIRPLSWMSASSTSSPLNNSLAMLDSDFFDAFPSVPENQPLVLPTPNPPSSYSRFQQQANSKSN